MNAFFRKLALGLAVMASVGAAAAQANWPNRPIRFVVPFPPGGSTDVIVRTIAPKVSATLGQPLVIDNKGGAGGSIGLDAVAKAPADGYTIGLASAGAMMALPHLMKVPYAVDKDLAFITTLARVPAVIVTGKDSGIATAQAMIDRARANPGKLNYAHAGRGTLVHLVGERFKAEAGLDLTPISYRGAAPALQGLMGGETELMVADLTAVWSALQNDQIRALAVTSAQRSPLLPGVPTVAELGYPKASYETDYGVVAPVGIAPAILAKLRAAFTAALSDEAVKDAYLKVGSQASPSTPEQYRDAVLKGSALWGEFIATHKIVAD